MQTINMLKTFVSDMDAVHIVLEIGTKFTKIGRSTDKTPVCFLKTSEIIQGKEVFLCDLQDDNEIRSFLKIFLTRIFDVLLICEANQTPLILIESSGFYQTSSFPQILDHVLFEDYEVPQVLHLNTEIAAIVAYGYDSGIVVDCGQVETRVKPVYKMHPIPSANQYYHLGSDLIEKRLNLALPNIEEYSQKFGNNISEDIKINSCYVMPLRDVEAADDISHLLANNQSITIPADVRHGVCECLFSRQSGEECTLASMILDSVIAAPIDTRKLLASHLIVIGGTSMIPGFHVRLDEEIHNLLNEEPYRDKISASVQFCISDTAFKANSIAWLGGAIVGRLKVMLENYVSRHDYKKSLLCSNTNSEPKTIKQDCKNSIFTH